MGPAWSQDVTYHVIAIKQYMTGANATSNSVNNLLTKNDASLEQQDSHLYDLDEKVTNNKDNINEVQRLAWQESKESSNIANTAKAEVLALCDDFIQYVDHIKEAIQEEASQLCQELSSQFTNNSTTESYDRLELNQVQQQVDDIAATNNEMFQEMKRVCDKGEQSIASLKAELKELQAELKVNDKCSASQRAAIKDFCIGMVQCTRLIERLCSSLCNAEIEIADAQAKLVDSRCRCTGQDLGVLGLSGIPSGESTTLQPTSISVYNSRATLSSLGRQSLPQVFAVLPTPVDTPQAPKETGPARSSCTNFFDRSCHEESPPCCCPQVKTPTQFKPMNLPKFDPKGNVHIFICLFEMSMYGANNQDKATTLLNQLDATSTDLIIPHMPKHNWLYAAAKSALLYKFGSIARVTKRKNEFLMISFRKDKTIADFANRFYLEAQILTVSGSLTVHNAHIALRAAVKPYEALYQNLMLAFQDNFTLDGMVRYLRQCSNTFGPPNTGPKPCPVSNYPGRLEAPANNNKSMPKPDITKVVCHCCNQKGHYASSCSSKTGIHKLPSLESKVQGKVSVE
ncbi:hypothetical protein DSO57_1001079 [Entomophthora muscae]|uniref:Uncharacterized protein n=1 Tax=Entomophthora muscae TaxID=34485 RepID=A0ACC2RP28_9FUNG|nr:hypothetical protein DSO57_1001079 [Entomophthora muscae]